MSKLYVVLIVLFGANFVSQAESVDSFYGIDDIYLSTTMTLSELGIVQSLPLRRVEKNFVGKYMNVSGLNVQELSSKDSIDRAYAHVKSQRSLLEVKIRETKNRLDIVLKSKCSVINLRCKNKKRTASRLYTKELKHLKSDQKILNALFASKKDAFIKKFLTYIKSSRYNGVLNFKRTFFIAIPLILHGLLLNAEIIGNTPLFDTDLRVGGLKSMHQGIQSLKESVIDSKQNADYSYLGWNQKGQAAHQL